VLPVNAANVVFHVVHTTKDPFAAFMSARDARIMTRLMTIAVLLGREASFLRLRAILIAAEEMLGVTFIVLAQITAPGKAR
jgi:hypothetical protein